MNDQREAEAPLNEQLLDRIGEALLAALYLCEDSEDAGDPETIACTRAGYDRLEKAINALDEWPHEPGYEKGIRSVLEITPREVTVAEAARVLLADEDAMVRATANRPLQETILRDALRALADEAPQ